MATDKDWGTYWSSPGLEPGAAAPAAPKAGAAPSGPTTTGPAAAATPDSPWYTRVTAPALARVGGGVAESVWDPAVQIPWEFGHALAPGTIPAVPQGLREKGLGEVAAEALTGDVPQTAGQRAAAGAELGFGGNIILALLTRDPMLPVAGAAAGAGASAINELAPGYGEVATLPMMLASPALRRQAMTQAATQAGTRLNQLLGGVLRHVGETGVGGYVGSLYGHPFLGAIGLPAAEAAARTAWHASTNLAKNILERPWGTAGDVSRYLWGGMQSTSMAPQTPPGQGGLQPGWGNRLLQNWPQGL